LNILLADTPALEKSYDASYPNLGLLYLAGYLREHVKTPDLKVQYLGPQHTLKSHLEFVKNFRPDIYGLSVTSRTAGLAYRTIEAVKTSHPGTLVVCGGAHATALPAEVIAYSLADICVIGEGEVTFSEIVNAAANTSADFSKIAGTAVSGNGAVEFNQPRPFVADLDQIPLPAWDLIDFTSYPGMHLKKQPIESSMLISRGCPYDCAFCSNPVWKSAKPWLRHRSIENICREVDYLYSRGVREIYMTSDELNFDEKWAIELCKAITKLNYKDLFFQCNMRADKVSDELAASLAAMNCWLVHLGIESANDRVLEGIGKHITVAQVHNATQDLSRESIRVFAFMMLYQVWEENGILNFESHEEVNNSMRIMRELYNKGHIHYMSWQFATPMPGSRLFKIAQKHNLFRGDPNKVFEMLFDEHDIAMDIPGLSEKSMRWKLKKGILLKDWFMIRSGAISLRHLWRVRENIIALIR